MKKIKLYKSAQIFLCYGSCQIKALSFHPLWTLAYFISLMGRSVYSIIFHSIILFHYIPFHYILLNYIIPLYYSTCSSAHESTRSEMNMLFIVSEYKIKRNIVHSFRGILNVYSRNCVCIWMKIASVELTIQNNCN